MKMRTKSALVVFIGLALAFTVVFSFDYTDRYVSDRFHEAVEQRPADGGRPFSLDAFLQYYDWDSVCVVLPGSDQDFTTLLGSDYAHRATDMSSWSLVFLRDGAVTAEITIDRRFLEHPMGMEESCLDRWGAVFYMTVGQDGQRYLHFSGN